MAKNVFKSSKAIALLFLLCKFFFLGIVGTAVAQESPHVFINKIVSSVNAFNDNLAIEKLYLQTDKPYYTAGDTLWFKAYLLDASSLSAVTKSGILYVEIASDSNIVMKRIMLPVYQGITFGQIALGADEMPQGGYILRAYTNWMRNFGDDYIFKKHFYIDEVTDKDWLINYNSRVVKATGKEKVLLGLRFDRFDKNPVGLREMRLRMTDGRRTVYKGEAETNSDGILNVNFDLPEKADPKGIMLNIQDMRKGEGNRKMQVPVIFSRPERMDLQFMPEGGNMVAGQPARIAFKAVDEDGMGADVSGKIINSKLQEVAVFRSAHKGNGSFNLVPEHGEIYTAQILQPDGSPKNYPLPAVKSSSTSLTINNSFQSDSCEIMISATPDVAALGNTYFLIGQARGITCYGAFFKFHDGTVKFRVSKKLFPAGIAHFTLCGADRTALNERIIFIDYPEDLHIDISADKPFYHERDSTTLRIKVTDRNGTPVQGSFSLAVTDEGQVKTDSMTSNTIVSRMLLTGDLRGHIEDPGYYLQPKMDMQRWQALDELLLTQGWVGYDWSDVFKPAKAFTYASEQEFLIKGRVTNFLNKPVAGSGVALFSKSPLLVMDTITDARGIFNFKGIFPADTALFFIQSRNKRGKSFNVGIEMDEFQPPVFATDAGRTIPWYVNSDTSRLLSLKKQVRLRNDQARITGGNVLNTVVVNAKRIVKESKNLNGPGEADIIIDDKQLEKAGRTTLGDLLSKNIPGFGPRADKSGHLFYKINNMMVHLIIDGIDTEFFLPEGTSLYQYFKTYFDYYDAEEIKGIEVMQSGKYQMRYSSTFLDPMATPWDHAFIEVTTRGGKGPFVKKTTGTYLYKPLPFSLPKKFYTPKYHPGSVPDMTDIRSTIFWEPNIITDKEGKATITFFTADSPGNYSLIIEVIDLQGGLGVKRGTVLIRKQ